MEVACRIQLQSREKNCLKPENGSGLPTADSSEANLEKLSLNASESHAVARTKGESNQSHHEVVKPGISGEGEA